MSGTVAAGWLVQMVLGGGLLLLLTRLVMARTAEPALQQRLGEVGLLSALLLAVLALGPAWLPITLPHGIAPAAVSPTPSAPAPAETAGPQTQNLDPDLSLLPDRPGEEEPLPRAAPIARELQPDASTRASWPERIVTGLVAAYAAAAGLILLRWLFGHVVLAWLLRGAEPAPAKVKALLDELRPGCRPRLLASPRVRAPFSYGLFRPTMVLPSCLLEAPPQVLRWVLAHELSHVERRDSRAGLLLTLGQAAFFYVPWFWWLRRQVRLCQEYVADAAAVAAGGRPEDYAAFLLGWTNAPRAPLVATGVFGSPSDLYRRITRLLQPPAATTSRPRRWVVTAGAGLLSLAVVLPGLHVQSQAATPNGGAGDGKKPAITADEKKEQGRKDGKTAQDREAPPAPIFPNLDQLLDRFPVGTDAMQLEELRHRLEAMRKQIELQAGRMLPDAQGGRLGVLARAPESALTAQLDLPKDQGMVLEEVGANSAAAKAGMKRHDILLELNGKPVPSKKEDFVKLLDSIKAKTPVGAVVVRKGKKLAVNGLMLPAMKQLDRKELFRSGVD